MDDFILARDRDASPAIRGFVYQVELTVISWLDLQRDEYLDLERGEDIDLVRRFIDGDVIEVSALLIQIKNLRKNITIRAEESIGALASFYEHIATNPLKNLRFRFMTNTAIGMEREDPFQPAIPALQAWEMVRKGMVAPDLLPSYLKRIREIVLKIKKPAKLNSSTWKRFTTFFKGADDEELASFIMRVEWLAASPELAELRPTIVRRLMDEHSLGEEAAKNAYFKICYSVFKILSNPGLKRLTQSQLAELIITPALTYEEKDLFLKLEAVVRSSEKAIREDISALSLDVKAGFDDQRKHLTEQTEILKNIASGAIRTTATASDTLIEVGALQSEYESELEYAKGLVSSHRPGDALEFLLNLRERIKPDSTQLIRYRVTSLIGSALLDLDRQDEGAVELIKAHNILPDDEKSCTNAAHAYTILGEVENANGAIENALKINPYSVGAFSALVQVVPFEELEATIARIPRTALETPSVKQAIGHVYRKHDDLDLAIKWHRDAKIINLKTAPDLDAALGTVLLEQALHCVDISLPWSLPTELLARVQEAAKLISNAWDALGDAKIRKARAWWLSNLATAWKAQGDNDRARHAFEEAVAFDPGNRVLVRNAAYFFGEIDDFESALALLRARSGQGDQELMVALAEFERLAGHPEEAIRILLEVHQDGLSREFKRNVKRLLAISYDESAQHDRALEILLAMKDCDHEPEQILLDIARIYKRQGLAEKAAEYLELASKEASKNNDRANFVLANSFYEAGDYEKAVIHFERLKKTHVGDWIDKRFAYSLFNLGNQTKLLALFEEMKSESGPIEDIGEMEAITLEEAGDYNSALRACNDFICRFPTHPSMRLRRAVQLARLGLIEELQQYLDEPKNFGDMSLDAGLNIVKLFLDCDRKIDALKAIFEVRRVHFGDGEAHLKYVGFFMTAMRNTSIDNSFSSVRQDTAVSLETRTGGVLQFVLEDRAEIDSRVDEISIRSTLGAKLLGRFLGDQVPIKENLTRTEHATIASIESKYIFALRQSREFLEGKFGDVQGFWSIELPEPTDLTPIKEVLKQSTEKSIEAETLYKTRSLTVGMLSRLLGRSVIKIWGWLATHQDLGFKASLGQEKELENAFEAIESGKQIVLDLLAFVTIHNLEIKDQLVSAYGKFAIAQSTIEAIESEVEELRGGESTGLLTIGHDGDSFFKREVSPKEIRDQISFFERLINWAMDNCEVLPSIQAFSSSRTERIDNENVFGESFYHSVLIAHANGFLLYSDDYVLRLYFENQLGVKGIWTQALLFHARSHGHISEDEFAKATISLIRWNYRFTKVDSGVVLRAIGEIDPMTDEPLKSVLTTLEGPGCSTHSAAAVCANTLLRVWTMQKWPQSHGKITLAILTSYFKGRNPKEAWHHIIQAVNMISRGKPRLQDWLLHILFMFSFSYLVPPFNSQNFKRRIISGVYRISDSLHLLPSPPQI